MLDGTEPYQQQIVGRIHNWKFKTAFELAEKANYGNPGLISDDDMEILKSLSMLLMIPGGLRVQWARLLEPLVIV